MNLSISCTRLAGTLSPKLESVDPRSVGSPNCGWLPIRPTKDTTPVSGTKSDKNHSGEFKPSDTRGNTTVIKRGNSGDPIDSTQLHLPDIPSGEEGWWAEASDKPERPQSVCEGGTFQDGGSLPPSRSPTIRGLDGEDGPKRCIPPSAHQSQPSTPSLIPVGGEVLYVHMPTLRSLCSTKGIYQTTETSSGLPSAGGMSSDNIIPGRSTVLTPGQGQTTTYGSTNQSALRGLRTDGQPQEVDSITCPELGIPGVQHQLPNNANITTSREDEENPIGFQSITGSAVSISSSDSPVCGQDNSYPVSSTNSSSALQSSTVSDELSCSSQLYPGRDNRQVQHHSTTGPREQSRSNMVELTEQEGFINPCYTTSTISDHRVRCIQPGLGCCTGGINPDWRSLDGRGSNASYQLPGTASSVSCDQGIWKGPERHSSPTPYGQYNSSFICQSLGRYNLSQAVQISHHNVDLVHFSEHYIDSRTPSRPPQCDSRPGIEASQKPLRLDAQSPCLSEDSGEYGTAGGRSICLSPDKATTTLLQLEGRPRGSSHRCIHAGLVSPERICKPTLVPDQSLPLQGESGGCTNSTSNTVVEHTTLVSCSTGTVGGLPLPAGQSTRFGSIASGSGVPNETGSS